MTAGKEDAAYMTRKLIEEYKFCSLEINIEKKNY